jgi:hypothetical protein
LELLFAHTMPFALALAMSAAEGADAAVVFGAAVFAADLVVVAGVV